ncbi:amidohydrolase [Methyloligella solikamskensis]|uniref:Amidohydrolase n=1 Tax=Methyloligella solikamskensis TaxID=1177756 RepID=A0ABW3J982_9HYPH
MSPIPEILENAQRFVELRRDLHAHPETGFEERRTAGIVADLLQSWGIETHTGIGGTGVVGVLRGRSEEGTRIGLRADFDALPIEEQADVPWRSTVADTFHGCGHDGHTASLLAAAHYLSRRRPESGTVTFIFQPAEEGLGGARAMLADGLFERFPCDVIFGCHNWPDLNLGEVQVCPGPVMAGAEFFDITLSGTGSHAAMPHHSRDVIVAAADLIGTLQTIVSRNVDPLESAVVSLTEMHGGSAYNVIPRKAELKGTIRHFKPEVRDAVIDAMKRIIVGAEASHDVSIALDLRKAYPVTVNDPSAVDPVVAAARTTVGESNVFTSGRPTMSSEDFGDMLDVVPGAYFMAGQSSDVPLHHPEYTYDDDLIPIVASIFARIVQLHASSRVEAAVAAD